uniref:Uncharacterized protein n=1 Tax=Ignisphaera aggregans TaxID=334771 RepID=A0A832EM55_9CREN
MYLVLEYVLIQLKKYILANYETAMGSTLSIQDIVNKVIEYLKWHPNAKPSEIAEYLGVNLRTVRTILTKLRVRGIVVRTDKGYTLKASFYTDTRNMRSSSVEGSSKQSSIDREFMEHGLNVPDIENIFEKIRELDSKINNIENIVKELKNTVLEIGNKSIKRSNCEALYEAIELLRMGLEAIRLGDQRSLDNVLTELESVVEDLRRCILS